jgi:hypothetical protein
MKPEASTGIRDIDDQLARLPDQLVTTIGRYEQRVGYKCWKVGSRNWLQWNDGGTALPIRFDNSRGEERTWKLFARFAKQPHGPWDKPAAFEQDHKWMPAGTDVWGCSYEGLREYEGRYAELEALLKDALIASQRYANDHYQ